MPIEPGATYVFDLGYYDYAWWAKLDAAQCRIVTRFRANTPLAVIEELPVPEGGKVVSDRIGFLPARQAKSRRNPMQDAVREVRVATESGKVLRLLSNDLDAPSQDIADLYKRRWAIELFFRWGQADPQDHPLSRHEPECCEHPDRHCPDRLLAAASRASRAENHPNPARLRQTGPRQSDAPQGRGSPARARTRRCP
jgi:Transposase DDE domain